MAGLLLHSVDPITADGVLSTDGVLGLLGLASAPPGAAPRTGGEAGEGGEARATGTGKPAGGAGAAGRTCWKADLTTSITSSASDESLCALCTLLSPLRGDAGERRPLRRGGGDEDVGDDVRSGVATTRPSGVVAENAECGDLCSGDPDASRSGGAGPGCAPGAGPCSGG